MTAALSGCALLKEFEARIKQQPPSAAAPPRAEPAPKPEPKARPNRPAAQRVAIVYTAGVPLYQSIAEAIAARTAAPVRLIPLPQSDGALTADAIRDQSQVVAVGAWAARSALQLPAKELVFCQVFNYRAHGLARDGVVGVSMVPPPEQQFRAWKSLAPDLRRIGVISGAGHHSLIEAARISARAHNAELLHREVRSDKEALYEFKRMVPDIDGFWLLPDERVLSHRVLRDIMDYGVKHDKLILSFTPELLRFGALLSASSQESDVADQVVIGLRVLSNSSGRKPFRMLPLAKTRIDVNADLVRQLGLEVPAGGREGGDEDGR